MAEKVKARPVYTVFLLYPDYMAEDYGLEYYATSVDVDSLEDQWGEVETAVWKARDELVNSIEDRDIDPYDFVVLAVMAGEINVLAGPETGL